MKKLLSVLFVLGNIAVNAQTNQLGSTGNAGIGTTTPTEKLEISSLGLSNIKLTHTSDVLGIVGTLKFNMSGTDVGRIEVERTIASNRMSVMKFFVKGDSLSEAMRINYNGSVGIGTTDTKGYKLAVNGSGIFTRLKVKAYGAWPDYVFHEDYLLPTLSSVEKFITENKHLPDMPSEKEVMADGQDVGDMNRLLLKKVEELTLYIIQLNKKMDAQQAVISALQK
ncbi:hypothetical protein CLV51_104444 [Chitinophaga niastensis]|uniref:DUF4468 domain-containing protein n=1 Tax=Chitinophaga niastensis TaxID=536980 RepID=A0A2P8HHQ4_CHINA|nr:hypothetical protein [Chitinophaga niastensis]PSL45737.1 hypothetical protein CLV51_104444 [Chitinophaga niastensis]